MKHKPTVNIKKKKRRESKSNIMKNHELAKKNAREDERNKRL